VTNPEDVAQAWFYKREWSATAVTANAFGSTATTTQTRTVYYPALGHRPRRRPRTINGHDVAWDTPVLHTAVNRASTETPWGTPDLYAALPWAQGYSEFLTDWAKLVRALSVFAFRATAKTGRGAAQVRSRLESADGVGNTAVTGADQKFEAIGKSGATIDSQSGRPLAAMVAAATDVPVTMLLADPGVTGARATAETLDKPLALVVGMRQELHGSVLTRILDYVIDQAVKAPQGVLTGGTRIDPVTGQERVLLANDQDRGVTLDWPSLDDVDVETVVKAIKLADDTGYVPPLIVLKMLLVALGEDNVDEVLEQVQDDDGNFISPDVQAALTGARDAIRSGTDQQG